MALPTGKQTSDFQVIEEGNYEVLLKRAALTVEKEYQSDAFNDGEGLMFQAIELTWDVDGEEWTEKFVKVSLHENSKLYNRLSSLLGRKISDTDQVHWGISEFAEKNHAIDNYYKAREDDLEKGTKQGDLVKIDESFEGIIGALDSITIDGVEIIGRTCMLALEINKNGYNRATAGAASFLPKRAGRKAAAAAPVEAVDEPDEDPDSDEPEEPAPAAAAPRGRGRTAPAKEETKGRSRRTPPPGAPS